MSVNSRTLGKSLQEQPKCTQVPQGFQLVLSLQSEIGRRTEYKM